MSGNRFIEQAESSVMPDAQQWATEVLQKPFRDINFMVELLKFSALHKSAQTSRPQPKE